MIIGVYGYHDSGKTMFLEKLIAELSKRGISASAVKHLGRHYEADKKKDTERLSKAGFNPVVGIADDGSIVNISGRMELRDALALLQSLARTDVIFVEGFKNIPMEKIAVGDIEPLPGTIFRSEQFKEIVGHIEKVVKLERGAGCCGQVKRACKGGEGLSELKVNIKVNGKKVSANEFVQNMFWETLCGMVKSLKGVDQDIEKIEISVSKE